MLNENKKRVFKRQIDERLDYDPRKGVACIGQRTAVTSPVSGETVYIPDTMLNDPDFNLVRNNADAWAKLRCRHDFEYWCVTCVKIRDKLSGRDIPFRLNLPQRRVAAVLEDDRLAGRPIRMILLKSRQWGGSTLVQIYMAWIQLCHRRNWNSVICAHVQDTAKVIRGMYTKILKNYPENLWDEDTAPEFRPFERAQNIREIAGRGCRVTISSAEKHDAVRGADFAMAHLSETAFWPSTTQHNPADFIRAVNGSISLQPYTLIIMESTANGVGNFFHSEWMRCANGQGDKHPVFVPWYDIEIYRMDPPDPQAFIDSWDSYERHLWDMGLCLDQIYWYHCKRSEYSSHHLMMAEFPTTPTEAFTHTGDGIFSAADIDRMREFCRPGKQVTIPPYRNSDRMTPLTVWSQPDPRKSYVVTVDVGGRSLNSDWSVIAVLSRDPKPEVVAQWRGHTDHDILADTAIAISLHYNRALLVIESNTLETDGSPSTLFILDRVARDYQPLYYRQTFDEMSRRVTHKIGFHTNRSTKDMIINNLIGLVRDTAYVERDAEACNELATYERTPNGAYAAKRGCHDDILMTRAIALYVISSTRPTFSPSQLRQIWDASA